MSKLSDHYPPLDMDSCDGNGLMGNCGEKCPLYVSGDCIVVNEEKICNNLINMSAIKHLEVNEAD